MKSVNCHLEKHQRKIPLRAYDLPNHRILISFTVSGIYSVPWIQFYMQSEHNCLYLPITPLFLQGAQLVQQLDTISFRVSSKLRPLMTFLLQQATQKLLTLCQETEAEDHLFKFLFNKILFIFMLCVCVFCLYVSKYTSCMSSARRNHKLNGFPGTGVKDGFKSSCGARKQILILCKNSKYS